MKNLSILTLAIAFIVSACGGQSNTTEEVSQVADASSEMEVTGSLDVAASTVNWKGVMMGMYDHTGNISISEGSLNVEGSEVKGGSFTIDMASINPTDENYDENRTAEKLVGHLSSPDFFDVENNPTATFEITEGGAESVTGTLTIRGKSNTETIQVSGMNKTDNGWEINGSLTFDRKKYDVAFDHPMQEMVISDDIELDITLVLK